HENAARAVTAGVYAVQGQGEERRGRDYSARDAAARSLQRAPADRCDHGSDDGRRYFEPHLLDLLYWQVGANNPSCLGSLRGRTGKFLGTSFHPDRCLLSPAESRQSRLVEESQIRKSASLDSGS